MHEGGTAPCWGKQETPVALGGAQGLWHSRLGPWTLGLPITDAPRKDSSEGLD